MKKYELTDETKVEHGVTLHRIRALVDIVRYGVKAGDLGGWIESEANLSQEHEWMSSARRSSRPTVTINTVGHISLPQTLQRLRLRSGRKNNVSILF